MSHRKERFRAGTPQTRHLIGRADKRTFCVSRGRDTAEHVTCFRDRMQHDRMQKTLGHLGINASNYKVLKLLPLVYVAWASGRITPLREERLVDLAHNHFAIGEDGERILRGWISEHPGTAYFKEGLHDILRLAQASDELEFDVDELPGLLAYAEAIARTTAEALDAPTSVTEGEEWALAEIAHELGIEQGESWGALVRELKAPLQPRHV
jgi:hypothetical protein